MPLSKPEIFIYSGGNEVVLSVDDTETIFPVTDWQLNGNELKLSVSVKDWDIYYTSGSRPTPENPYE